MAIRVGPELEIPDDELTWRFTASGGPGGQHANRSNTRVELTWDLAGSTVLTEAQRRRLTDRFGHEIRIVSDQRRSQLRNRDDAADRLAERVRDALQTRRPRRPTKPSKGATQRRIDAKRRTSDKKRMRSRPRHDD